MKCRRHFIKIIRLFIIGILITLSCNKKELPPPEGYVSVILEDLTGLDGCGYVLKLNSSEVLEPLNLSEFSINKVEGNEYWITYEKKPLLGSYCMVGDVVLLLDIKVPYRY